MRNTKKWKKLMTLAGIACFSLTALLSPVTTLTAEAKAPTTASTLADSIEWRYKEEDGKLYRRKYNYTTGSWIGQWEYVCDL